MEPSLATSPRAARSNIAERLWAASRIEFSHRGYHGARVQGIAKRAGCNVALLYRHWSSKSALYLDVLRSAYEGNLNAITALALERGPGAAAVVSAYVDAHLRDPVGAQILVREFLDGGPFFNQLVTAEPALIEPVRRAARALAESNGSAPPLRAGLDPTLSVLTIGALAALIAAAHPTAQPFLEHVLPVEAWREHLYDLLLHGVLARSAAPSEGG